MADALDGGLPHAVALTWGVAEMPQRGPKRELSIERIVDAAIEIADDEGLAGVSMSRVATSLGFTTMSLYRYVTSKDDLLLLMQDAACAVAIPSETDAPPWREGLRDWVRLTMGVYRDHPWFGDVPVSSVPMTPNNLLMIDWGLRIMQSVPLSGQEKMSTLLLLSSYTRAFGGFERDIGHAQREGSAPGMVAADALKELVTPERFPSLYPLVQSGEYADDEALGNERFDDFAFGVERILDGIQTHIDATADGTAVATAEAPVTPRGPDVTRDKGVREAAKARREVEVKLREALKREREAAAKARARHPSAG